MIDAIRQFLEENLAPRGQKPEYDERQLAAAALLIEVMAADYHEGESERAAVVRAVSSLFGLTPQDSERLVVLAQEEVGHATDDYEFTARINRGFSAQQKEALIEALWQVAYADGDIDMYERHYLSKLAELLYIPQSIFIAAKLRVCGMTGPG